MNEDSNFIFGPRVFLIILIRSRKNGLSLILKWVLPILECEPCFFGIATPGLV